MFIFKIFVWFEFRRTGSPYKPQGGLELTVLLYLPPECWDCWCALPYPVLHGCFLRDQITSFLEKLTEERILRLGIGQRSKVRTGAGRWRKMQVNREDRGRWGGRHKAFSSSSCWTGVQQSSASLFYNRIAQRH